MTDAVPCAEGLELTIFQLPQLVSVSTCHAMQVILLMRQIIPYTFLNYSASVPDEIHYRSYIIASILGQLPHNVIDVYWGGSVTHISDILA